MKFICGGGVELWSTGWDENKKNKKTFAFFF
jgi:hypothetical protein